jgi:hypothetical protein
MNKALKVIIDIVLLGIIVWLVVAIVKSVEEPVNFDKEKAAREKVGIQRLKDIRTLQVAYKSENGKFTASFDTLAMFYNEGKMDINMQVGSQDDSAAVAHTDAVKKAHRGITNQQLYEMYKEGDHNLVFTIKSQIPVKDTLFASRDDFNVDSLQYIPFSGKQKTLMSAVVKEVSGVQVPLFEASMPYKALLKGMDNQLRINLDDDRRKQNRYEGLQVGSISAPNNNAGNWE